MNSNEDGERKEYEDINSWLVKCILAGGEVIGNYAIFEPFPGQFKTEKEVLSYFGETDIVYALTFGPKTKKNQLIRKLGHLGFAFPYRDVVNAVFNEFTGKEVSESNARAMGYMLQVIHCDGSTICIPATENHKDDYNPLITFFSDFSLKDLPENPRYPNLGGLGKHSPGTTIAEKEFASVFFSEMPDGEIDWFYNVLRSPKCNLLDRFLPWILHAAMEHGLYQFRKEDIELFKIHGLTLYDFTIKLDAFDGDDFAPTDCINETISRLVELEKNDEITIADISSFLDARWGSSYEELLQKYNTLRQCKNMVAAAALTAVGQQTPRATFSGMFSSRRPAPEPLPTALQCLNTYPEDIRRNVALTYICDFINENDSGINEIPPELYETLNQYDDNDSGVALKNSLHALLGMIARVEPDQDYDSQNTNEMVLAFLLSIARLPNFDYFDFIPIESDDWWDYGSKEVPNNLQFKKRNWLTQRLKDLEFRAYRKLIDDAYKATHYDLVAEQSVQIIECSKMVWDLGDIHTIWLASLNQLSGEQLSKLDAENKLAAFFVASVREPDLAKKILAQLEAIKFNGHRYIDTDEPEVDLDYKQVLTENFKLWCKYVQTDEDNEYRVIFDMFADVIGRQQREVSPDTVIMSSCVNKAISAGVLKLELGFSHYHDGSESDYDEEYYRGYNYGRDLNRSCVATHYPRLRAGWTHLQIDFMLKHLKAKNLLEDSIEHHIDEGLFISNQTLYVIGEFAWKDVFAHTNEILSGEIAKVTVLTVTPTPDNVVLRNSSETARNHMTVTDVNLYFDATSIGIIHMLDVGVNFRRTNMHDLMNGIVKKTNFRNAFERILPEIEFKGVRLNQRH
ncbi:hypothetical protein [Vibrio vulnificus]|uniref:Uncharacterized protein n=1 Tax=Vibrio vulnificus TaxID=672 RepID=A0A2S3R1H1_VIBVL|nr:hypothetical protein [Vibrio vulnificus]POB46932.1 hypothetical protein CRN52_12700 [Vibrio vulnificus]